MNLAELRSLVDLGESAQVEFKRTTGQRTEAARTVCAMLNGFGGFVLFGISDRGAVAGQGVTTRTMEDIADELRRIEPPVFPDIETVPIADGRAVIAVRVSGGGGPYTFDGRPYMRYGPTTRVMPREQYERLLLEHMHATQRWETQPTQLQVADLDHTEIVRTVEEAIRRQRIDDPGTRDVIELLRGLGLIDQGRVLNAGVVLFGRAERLLPHYAHLQLRLARFRGVDKSEFIDNRQEEGHAFDLLQRAQRFLRDHLPVAGRVLPGVFERVDDPLYPPAALREALANALCHRDYGVGGGAVSVAIYDDRLEIASTGNLPFGLTPQDLLRPHTSRPWNPLVAHVFYRRGIIESWGRGTIRMAELSHDAGLVAPEIESGRGEVVVRFRPRHYVAPRRVGHDLTVLQRAVLDTLAEVGDASLKELLGHVQFRLAAETPERTLQDNLQLLRQLGLVELEGRGRGARWALKERAS